MSSNADATSAILDESNRFPITSWLSKQERRQVVGSVPLTYAVGVTGFATYIIFPFWYFRESDKLLQ